MSEFFAHKFSVTTRQIVLKVEDMVNMDVKLCKKVSKFKMSDSIDFELKKVLLPPP